MAFGAPQPPGLGGGAGLLGGLGSMFGPLALPGLLSFGPALFSHLFHGQSPEQKAQAQMLRLLTPQNFAKTQGQFFQQNLASPAYAMGQRAIGQGANAASNQVQANLGARGVGTSGSGALLASLTPSLIGNQMGQLQNSLWQQAGTQTQNSLENQLKAILGTMGPSQSSQLAGAGLAGFGPYLQAFMGHQYPGIFGNMGQQQRV